MFFFNIESTKFFEDQNGFIYKKVNENEKTVYYDCFNEPRCLLAARYYKQSKALKMFGTHSECCPPDAKMKMKMKIHFEEFLKKDVLANENAAVSVLNVYKRAIDDRYKGIWLPINHRSDFLPVLRRLRSYNKNKPKKSNRGLPPSKKDAATSPIGTPIRTPIGTHQVAIATAPAGIMVSKSPVQMNAVQNDLPTTSNAESGDVLFTDMATSPMQNLSLSELDRSTASKDDSLVEDQMKEPSDTVHQIDIRVVSNGGSTPLVLASSSTFAAPEIEKDSASKKVKLFFHFEIVND